MDTLWTCILHAVLYVLCYVHKVWLLSEVTAVQDIAGAVQVRSYTRVWLQRC
jgi:hypothetical protein